ncbi:MAG: hypothetical protein GY909_13345 [Oligoflexia bacterium]|nr:hypothetical protein [Oligoflexia bacterium]
MIRNFFRNLRKNEKGQVAVEYILLVAVMSALIFGLLGRVKDMMLPDPEACANTAAAAAGGTQQALGCTFINLVNTLGTSDGKYRFFTIRK